MINEVLDIGQIVEDEAKQMMLGFPVIPASVTKKYIILTMQKFWGSGENRSNLVSGKMGFTFGLPFGHEMKIAFVRRGKETVNEELPDDVITVDELKGLIEDYISLKQEFINGINALGEGDN